ncbi:MAG: hypothetical protein Q7I97_02310 [Thermovirgaceae bacterium]|nr:hypothetical protein [Thermovirgaceae bacterium]
MRKAIMAMALCFLAAAGTFAFAADVQKLVEERTVTLYPEGQLLGDMVIGARGKLQFIYVDRTLAEAVRVDPSVPEWLSWHAHHWGTDPVKGKTLFIVRYEAYKPWDFNTGDLAVGGRKVEPGDIRTRKAFVIEGEIPSGTVAMLALAIPAEFAPPGKAVVFAYMEESAEWVVPKK